MSENTTTTVQALPAQTLRGIVTRVQGLQTREAAATVSVDDARWMKFDVTAAGHLAIGRYFVEKVIPHMIGVSSANADAILAGFKSETSGIYVAPDKREGLPSKGVLSRALTMADLFPTDDAYDAAAAIFRAVGNAPGFSGSFIPWAQLHAGRKLRGTDVDIAGTGHAYVTVEKGKVTVYPAAGKGRTKVPGVIKRHPRETTPPAESLTLWDVMAKRSTDDLTATVAGWDFGDISTDQLESMARRAIAAYLIRTRAAKDEQSDAVDMSALAS